MIQSVEFINWYFFMFISTVLEIFFPMTLKIAPELSGLSWTKEARDLLSVLHGLSLQDSAMVFLRHSQREEPQAWKDVLNAPLTSLGVEMARIFGENLPQTRSYRIYHSRIERCATTAKLIQTGFISKITDGFTMEMGGYMPELTEFYMDPLAFEQMTKRDNIRFVRNWLAGFYPTSEMESALFYAQRVAHVIIPNHTRWCTTKAPGGIDLYISHDFNILVLRALWTGLFPTDNWISYLGGFIIVLHPDDMDIYYEGRHERVPYPHWWHSIQSVPF
jgi:hypothetical protein